MSSSRVELESLSVPHSTLAPAIGVDAVGAVPPVATKPSAQSITEREPVTPSRTRAVALIVTLSGISFLNTFSSGTLTVAIPAIAKDLDLPDNLLLWPASVYALGLCCTLLLLGAIADVVGNRPVFLIGSVLYTAWTLAVAVARTGNELIAFRALQGIAMSFCMPTAVSFITTTFPAGKLRNLAFAAFGGGSPIGFALGLVLGGVFVQVSGWRTSYYVAAALNAAIMVAAWFTLPASTAPTVGVRHKLVHDFDWVGVTSASTCLALLSYIFAELTYSGSVIRKAYNIALLVIAVLLIPFFILWEGRQERLGNTTILPNSVWRRTEFTTICITVFLVWAWFNAYDYWTTLFFQNTQGLSALQAALRYIPMVIVGFLTNVVCGYVMDKVSAGTLALVGGLVSAVGPLLFAVMDPKWTYWAAGFPAMCLCVVSSDLFFNISSLIITSSFPSKDQALAGGIFNTVAQLGNSIGPAVTAIITASIIDGEKGKPGVTESSATLKGYRAAFWTCFAAAAISVVISVAGLRKAGKVGMKRD